MLLLHSCSSIQSNSINLLQNDGKKSINAIGWAEKVSVVVKKGVERRPRLVLKFVWMEKNIGLGIDQVIPGGNGTIPLCPYYFWPRKDACEELKAVLNRKPWISDIQKELLLSQASDMINMWQHSGH